MYKNYFDGIAGYKEEKEELEKISSIIRKKDEFIKKGGKLPKGIFFDWS